MIRLCVLLCTILMLECIFSASADAEEAATGSRDRGLIEVPWKGPVEVVCRPAPSDSTAAAELIVLEEGQSPEDVCPPGRMAGFYFSVSETITGAPPPQTEVPPSD